MSKMFHDIIKDSLLKVESKYLRQVTVHSSRDKYNERVFCYEFYHQLRLNAENFQGLTISGEAVKSEFQFKNLGSNRTPDLLIHSFGTIDNNEVIIEVKTTKNRDSILQGLPKDFIKLDLFTDNATMKIDYKLGIYLLFNFDFWEIVNGNDKILSKVKRIIYSNNRIVVWNIPIPEFNENNTLKPECLYIYSNEELKNRISS